MVREERTMDVTLSSTETETQDKFSKDNLRKLKVRFRASTKMRKGLDFKIPKLNLFKKTKL